MVYIIHSIYENGLYRKELILILLICLINIVKTSKPYLFVPKSSNVELICNFTDNRKDELKELPVVWKKEKKNHERNRNFLEREGSDRINHLKVK